MAVSRQGLGKAGEDLAARWYVEAGYSVVARNWRPSGAGVRGEIDLVLAVGRVVVFCEVKTRTSDYFGSPAEAVNYARQRRLRTLAAVWLAQRETRVHVDIRFDVASILAKPGFDPVIDVIEGAF